MSSLVGSSDNIPRNFAFNFGIRKIEHCKNCIYDRLELNFMVNFIVSLNLYQSFSYYQFFQTIYQFGIRIVENRE